MEAKRNQDFFQAASALMQCSSDPGTLSVTMQRKLESNLGKAASALLHAATKDVNNTRLEALQSDFGRTGSALLQCSSDPGEKPMLEVDFAKAAYNLMQCSSDPGTAEVSPEFKKAAVALLKGSSDPAETDAKKVALASDFSKVAAALLQCSSGG